MDLSNLAPLVVFAFNRPDVLSSTLMALKNNRLAEKTDLYIFIDGPRTDDDIPQINMVKDIAEEIDGFSSKQIICSSQNKGLANSIISGVTKVLEQSETVIVVEDDLYAAPCFLYYMNMMLQGYRDDNRIFQISGFSTKCSVPKGYDLNYYMSIRAHSWSWGTWKDRWDTVDWNVSDYEELLHDRNKQKAFNRGGSDLFGMLKGYMTGKNNSWFIRFTYEMHKQKKFAICPLRSLVRNDGFIANSTHCNTYNRYKIDFNTDKDTDFCISDRIEFNESLNRSALKYWSVRYRIYGKIMNIFKS